MLAIETKLSKAISEKNEFDRLLQKSQEGEQKTLKIVKESQIESEKAKRERADVRLKSLEEIQIVLEKSRKKELHALQIVKVCQNRGRKNKGG